MAPMLPGDSGEGGATLNVKGEVVVVGINSRIVLMPFVEATEVSYRPDPAVVSKLIEADFAKRRGKD